MDDQFGISVAISGDTVVVGANFDDDGGSISGSAYVYRLAVPSVARLLVADHLGNPVSSGGNAAAFAGQKTGTLQSHTFTLTNSGTLALNLQTISLGGADAGQFGLGVPDISPNPDLAQSASLNVTITFQPASASGLRHAILLIVSNDTNTPVYSVNLSGLGLSDSTDGDGDGMNDWPEYALRRFGFDWQATQDNLVADYYDLAPEAGLVTLGEVAGLQAGAVLLNVDPVTNRADFTIQLKRSDDLMLFDPITADPARISVDAQGRISYEVDAPAGKRFFLMGVSQ